MSYHHLASNLIARRKYHAYGDAGKVAKLVKQHSTRIRKQIDLREEDEVGRIMAEYEPFADRLAKLDEALVCLKGGPRPPGAGIQEKGESLSKLEKQREKVAARMAERDEKIAESRRRAEVDRQDSGEGLSSVGKGGKAFVSVLLITVNLVVVN